MSLAAALLGRREPGRARSDLVCGISSARPAFDVLELDAGAAAIAYDAPAAPSGFHELLAAVGEATGSRTCCRGDSFGLTWVAFSGAGLEDLAMSIGVAAESLDAAGYWELVVCAVFAFEAVATGPGAPLYLVYDFTRGTFYAFVPREDGSRDSPWELRLHAALAHDLRLEPDPLRRYPVWGVPV